MNRGISDEEYQRILAANPEWQDDTPRGQLAPPFIEEDLPGAPPSPPRGAPMPPMPPMAPDAEMPQQEMQPSFPEGAPRFVERPDSEQYLTGGQKQALKSKLYAYLADKMKRRAAVTSKPYYDQAEKAFAHQERVSDANALGGLLLNAGDRAGTVLGRGPASNFGQFANALDESRQTRIGNMRALRGLEEQSNADDLNVARYITDLERGDQARKDRLAEMYAQMARQRQRDYLDERRQAETERSNLAREGIMKSRAVPGKATKYTPIATSKEGGVVLIDPENPDNQKIVNLPKGFTAKGEKKDETIGGKTRLKPGEMGRLNDGRDAFKEMDFVEKLIPSIKTEMGPIKGRFGGLNPYNTEAQKVQADLKKAAQTIGKYLEGGVLRKEDESKYEKMLPALSDTEEVAKYKAKQIRNMLSERYADDLKALQAQGYSTEGFKAPEPSGQSRPMVPSQAKAAKDMTPEERRIELERLRKSVGQ